MCLNGFCCKRTDENNKTFISSDNEIVVIERQYGCYRLGILVACGLVLVLILGTIPATLAIRNNKIVLICLCITLAIVIILLSLFFLWQQRNARRLRELYGRPYIPQIYNHNNLYTSIPTASQTSWMFWNTKKDGSSRGNETPRSPGIQHNPCKISSLQEASESPQYTTIV